MKHFVDIRHDVATRTLARSSPGKFVETFVKALQHLESGTHAPQPQVDAYLRALDAQPSSLDDGLRMCASRVARAMYTMRNKRSIAHAGEVDPSTYDLRFLLSGAQWCMAELVRQVTQSSMDEAGALIEAIQTPVGTLIEDFGGKKLVLTDLSIPDEILALLLDAYPEAIPLADLTRSMDRRNAGSVRNSIRALWASKNVEGDGKVGYRLTQLGHARALEVVRQHFI